MAGRQRGPKLSLAPAPNSTASASRRHRQRQRAIERQLEARADAARAENDRLRAKLMTMRRELEFLLLCWRRQAASESPPTELVEAVRAARQLASLGAESSSSANAGSSSSAESRDQLNEQLKRQLEFYLGEGNLLKDRFLNSELEKHSDGCLPLKLFLRFNRVTQLCQRAGLLKRDDVLASLRRAVEASSLLALENVDGGLRVRRVVPLRQLEPVDQRTVYVDGLSGISGGKIDHDCVAKMFSTVGQVLYISLPRYRSTGDPKGFAFVEFETSSEAQLAVDRLNTVPRSDWRARLPKFSSQVKALLRSAEVLRIDTTQLETALYEQGCGGGGQAASTSSEGSDKRLAVMPKSEWERLRQEMKAKRDREISKLRNKVQKAKSAEASRSIEDAKSGAAAGTSAPPAHLHFSPGLIVRLQASTSENSQDSGGRDLTRKRIRDHLQLVGDARDAVAYIDIAEDGRTAWLRCRDADATAKVLALLEQQQQQQTASAFLSGALLTGQEERDYWDKIRRDWEEKHRPSCPLTRPTPAVKRAASPASGSTSCVASGSTSGVASGSTSGVASGSTSGIASGSQSNDAKRPKRIVFDSDED